MYLISEFSRITKLTVKTLHYYHKEGLLVPYQQDQQTGYRYYNEDNYQQAQMLALLRELDFSILEMKDVLANQLSPADFHYFLNEKRQQIQERLRENQALLARLTAELDAHELPQVATELSPISETTSPALLTISQAFYGRYEEIGPTIGTLYKAAGPHVAGPVTSLLYDDHYQEQATMRICLPVTKRLPLKQSAVDFWQLPSQPVLSLLHSGPYSRLSESYKRLLDYAKEQDYELTFPSREDYLKGPGRAFSGNPDSYETQLMIPFKKMT